MQNLEGETSLAVALRHGHLKVAQQLVDSGANANTRDKQMETLLCSVIKSGSFSKAKLLIDAGVDVEAKCLAGISPLEMAFNSEDLHIAEILLAAGANVNIAINGGETLLNKAITNNQLEAVQLLLAAGADVEAVGKDGVWKPLLQAAGLGNIDIIRVLLNYHADTEAKNLVSQQILIRILYEIAIPTNMSYMCMCMCMYVYHISGPLDPTSIGR
jgi:cytohesin